MSRSTAASFSASIATANRRKDYPVLSAMFDKEKGRRLLEALGAPLPRDFTVLGPLSNLAPPHLTEPRVIKPARSSNNRGVMALIPTDRGRWHDLMTGNDLTFGELVGTLTEARLLNNFADHWVLEEVLLPPDGSLVWIRDVKFNMFGDLLACSFVRANDPRGFQWFDADWNRVDVGIHAGKIDASIQPPEHAQRLVAVAQQISAVIPLPYLRVDVYETNRGPVVGELTPLPGWYYQFNDEWDEKMGLLYENRERELFTAGMDWSRLSPSPLHELFGNFGTARR